MDNYEEISQAYLREKLAGTLEDILVVVTDDNVVHRKRKVVDLVFPGTSIRSINLVKETLQEYAARSSEANKIGE